MPFLCVAALHDSVRALSALLAGGANPSMADDEGLTAAHVAATFGHTACLRRLVAAGAQLEARTSSGSTPLMLAVQLNQTEACQLLISAGASVVAREPPLRRSQLHWASHNGSVVIIDSLVAAGAELDARSSDGRTPLSAAAGATLKLWPPCWLTAQTRMLWA